MTKKQTTREKLLDYTFEEVYIHGYNATSIVFLGMVGYWRLIG